MVFTFLIGPILIVLWLIVPFIAKGSAIKSLFVLPPSQAYQHAALANVFSLIFKLIMLRCVAFLDNYASAQWSDWLGLALYPLFLLTAGSLVGAYIELRYIRTQVDFPYWKFDPEGKRAYRILFSYNLALDAMISVPTLIFCALGASGSLSTI